jgi:hypothetical protein
MSGPLVSPIALPIVTSQKQPAYSDKNEIEVELKHGMLGWLMSRIVVSCPLD